MIATDLALPAGRRPARSATLAAATLAAVAFAALAAPPSADAAKGPCVIGHKKGPKCHIWKGKVGVVDDGDSVRIRIRGDRSRTPRRVRLTGIQAMELSRYGRKRGRRGACHAVEAAERLERLIRSGKSIVRIAARRRSSTTGPRKRLRRSIAVKDGRGWRDPAAVLLREGLALWLPNRKEWPWNRDYSRLAQEAAARGVGLWNTAACRFGPKQSSPLRLKVKWDANGTDGRNVNGEWVRISNDDPVNAVPLGGWWFRDSHLRRFTFPRGTVVPARGSIRLHAGRGRNRPHRFHWGLRGAIFENATGPRRHVGDGGYLFDPHGDLRAWVQYPCRVGCSDPLAGKLRIRAHARGREYITVTNVSTSIVHLGEAEIESRPWFYEFRWGTLLLPGERFRLFVRRAPGGDTRLRRSWRFRRNLLADRRDVVTLRNRLGAPVVCHAWGRGKRCPRV